MRTIIDLPDDQLEGLANACREEGISRAEAIRRAVDVWLSQRRSRTWTETVRKHAGVWRGDFDSREFIDELREEWSERDRRLGL